MIAQTTNIVTIELDYRDSELFKLFRQYQDKIAILAISGALDIKSGSCTIHYSGSGDIQKIEGHSIKLYQK